MQLVDAGHLGFLGVRVVGRGGNLPFLIYTCVAHARRCARSLVCACVCVCVQAYICRTVTGYCNPWNGYRIYP